MGEQFLYEIESIFILFGVRLKIFGRGLGEGDEVKLLDFPEVGEFVEGAVE